MATLYCHTCHMHATRHATRPSLHPSCHLSLARSPNANYLPHSSDLVRTVGHPLSWPDFQCLEIASRHGNWQLATGYLKLATHASVQDTKARPSQSITKQSNPRQPGMVKRPNHHLLMFHKIGHMAHGLKPTNPKLIPPNYKPY